MSNPAALQGVARRLVPRAHLAVLAAGWLWLVVYAWPGLMTMDSVDQLTEARSGFYTDSHPPLMAAMWRYLDMLYPGPAAMLLVQSVVFVAGLYLVLRRALRPVPASLATTALTWFPPIFTPLAVIWKDCVMAGLLLLATAALLDRRRPVRLAGLVLCMVATSFRYNAPAATFALIVVLFTWHAPDVVASWRARIARHALATGLWIATTVGALGIGVALTDRTMHIWHSSLALMDMAGTLANLDATIPDSELRPLLSGTRIQVDRDVHAAIRRQYSSLDFSPLIHGDGHLWDVPIAGTTPAPTPQRDAIAHAFWQLVTRYPGAYLKHRATVMGHALALTAAPSSTVMNHKLQWAPALARLGLPPPEPSSLQWRWQRRLSHLADRHLPSLYRAWIYAVLAIALLAFCRRQRDVLAILLSGLGLESSLFVLTPTPDYRYSHWLVICTCVATVMLVARRLDSVHNRHREVR